MNMNPAKWDVKLPLKLAIADADGNVIFASDTDTDLDPFLALFDCLDSGLRTLILRKVEADLAEPATERESR